MILCYLGYYKLGTSRVRIACFLPLHVEHDIFFIKIQKKYDDYHACRACKRASPFRVQVMMVIKIEQTVSIDQNYSNFCTLSWGYVENVMLCSKYACVLWEILFYTTQVCFSRFLTRFLRAKSLSFKPQGVNMDAVLKSSHLSTPHSLFTPQGLNDKLYKKREKHAFVV